MPPRPAFAAGSLALSIPPLARTLAVRVTPRARELEPGGSTTLDVEVADADRRPVANAELAVVVVDEAVLALSGYAFGDPIASFYARREGGVRGVHSRSLVKLAQPEALQETSGSRDLESGAVALMATEGVTLTFTDDAIDAIADIAVAVNSTVENIGARRLHTVVERVLDDISFDASDRGGNAVVVDGAYVHARVGDLARNADLSKFIL